jgi:hypothetical protein
VCHFTSHRFSFSPHQKYRSLQMTTVELVWRFMGCVYAKRGSDWLASFLVSTSVENHTGSLLLLNATLSDVMLAAMCSS